MRQQQRHAATQAQQALPSRARKAAERHPRTSATRCLAHSASCAMDSASSTVDHGTRSTLGAAALPFPRCPCCCGMLLLALGLRSLIRLPDALLGSAKPGSSNSDESGSSRATSKRFIAAQALERGSRAACPWGGGTADARLASAAAAAQKALMGTPKLLQGLSMTPLR